MPERARPGQQNDRGVERPQAARAARSVRELQSAIGNRALARLARAGGPLPTPLLQAAAADPSSPLAGSVRRPLERALGRRLDGVRVHSGEASEAAADAIGARAYTIGNDIFLGRQAHSATSAARERMLAHEAVHTVQQGSRAIALRDTLRLGAPDTAAEREAAAIAEAVTSPSQLLRQTLRVTRVEPVIQRDLTGSYDVPDGKFRLDLTQATNSSNMTGLRGTIKFHPSDTAPDSTSIRLLQVVRTENLATGAELQWTGDEAGRMNVQTVADPVRGMEPGWFVDHSAKVAGANRRTKSSDPAVSPYYRDYWPNASESQDGSKAKTAIQDASLWDWPASSGRIRFSFETQAKATDTGHYYGSVAWGFTVQDPAKKTLSNEWAYGRNVTLQTTDEALRLFNEYYRNPGATTAP
jgi:hypothetical protein